MKLDDIKNIDFPRTNMEEWRNTVDHSLKGKAANLETSTLEEIFLKPLYTKLDDGWKTFSNEYPGQSTFIRGINEEGDDKYPWVIAQKVAANDMEQLLNKLERAFLGGQEAFSFDLPEDISKEDMYLLFQKFEVHKRPICLLSNKPMTYLYVWLYEWAEEKQVSLENFKGLIGWDPISTFTSLGSLPKDDENYFRRFAEGIQFANQHLPNLRTILVDSSIYENGGANVVQQLAYSLAMAVEYVEKLKKHGLLPEDVFSTVVVNFAIGSSFFMEIAKLRAARALWAKIGEAYDVPIEYRKMVIRAETTKLNKTVTDPYVNMLRSGAEAFAASIGQVQYMHVTPFDEVNGIPSEFGERIARNTQHIIREETSITNTMDPAGGSWFIEELTKTLMEKAWELFLQIEENGGFIENLKSGKIQEQIREMKNERVKNVANRKAKLIGTNVFANLSEEIRSELKNDQNSDQNGLKISHSIKEIKTVQSQNSSFTYITNGLDIEPIKPIRLSQTFEQLRMKAMNMEKKFGKKPTIGLIGLGELKQHKVRADFIHNFLSAGGIDTILSQECFNEHGAIQFIKETKLSKYFICGTNEQYEQLGSDWIKAILSSCESIKIYLAGVPNGELLRSFQSLGLEGYIDVRTNCYEMNARLLQELEVELNETGIS